MKSDYLFLRSDSRRLEADVYFYIWSISYPRDYSGLIIGSLDVVFYFTYKNIIVRNNFLYERVVTQYFNNIKAPSIERYRKCRIVTDHSR